MNNRLLFGETKRQFVYPEAVGRWCNFWTIFGGDLVVLDDRLKDSVVGAKKENYKDVMVPRLPFVQVGHERKEWFSRRCFVERLCNQLEHHLYR